MPVPDYLAPITHPLTLTLTAEPNSFEDTNARKSMMHEKAVLLKMASIRSSLFVT